MVVVVVVMVVVERSINMNTNQVNKLCSLEPLQGGYVTIKTNWRKEPFELFRLLIDNYF